MTLLSLSNLTVLRGQTPVVQDVTFDIQPGECVGLIGPNGAGKTTLMRAALGLVPHSGTASLAALPTELRAKQAAWLPQNGQIAWPMTVERVVALGRIPHLPRAARPSPADTAAIDAALMATDLSGFRTRIATDLSGGEQARVLIARALAQDTPLLMADEPCAGLDPANQIATMQCFAARAKQGRAVLTSLHDLGLAARHCTRLIVLHQGRVYADGTAAQVLTPACLSAVFGITAHFAETADGPIFQPLSTLP